jgi:hypothetical protein
VIKWFDAPPLKSVLGAPDLGRVYGGGDSLSAFEFARGKKRALWSRANITVDKSLHERNNKAAYRDLELDGKTIWAACVCDAVDGKAAKALVKLSTEGGHDASWVTRAAKDSFGHEVVDRGRKLYLAAGGVDTLRLGSGKDKGRGGRGQDHIRAVDGSKDHIFCGTGADRVRANPGDNVAKGCEKIIRAGKRVG